MRKFASLLVVAGLAAGLILVVAAPSGASVPAKTSKFCKAVKNFDTADIGNPTSEKGAAKSLKGLKKLQNAATGNVKKAMNTIVDAYEQVADGDSAGDAFAKKKVIKAFATFAIATGKCFVNDLPNITLPDISLP